jgi:hypothetical protein
MVFLSASLMVRSVLPVANDWPATCAGIAAASFVAVAEPLVEWSRMAWPPSLFLLAYTAGVYCCYRGFVLQQARWQVAGAFVFVLALFTYEFAILLPAGLGLYLTGCLIGRERSWHRGGATLTAMMILLFGILIFIGSALSLRAGTVAGRLSEIETFVRPAVDFRGLAIYVNQVFGEYAILAGLALLGLPLIVRRHVRSGAYFGALLVVGLAVPVLVIQVHQTTRYVLQVLPLLAVLAAAGAVLVARQLGDRMAPDRQGWIPFLLRGAPYLLVALLFSITLSADVGGALRRWRQAPTRTTWLQDLEREDISRDSLILTDAPTILNFYVAQPTFYVHDKEYARYAYRAEDGLRSIYTDSLLLREPADFERQLAENQTGRTLWVVGRLGRLDVWIKQSAPGRWEQLRRAADREVKTRDGWVLLRVKL